MQFTGWFFLSLVSALAYATTSNMIFYLGNQKDGFNMTALNCAVYAVIGFVIAPLLYYVERQRDNESAPTFVRKLAKSKMLDNYGQDVVRGLTDWTVLKYVLFTGLVTVFANVCLYSAYASSPNPGMCDAISSSASFVSLILSAFLLGSKIEARAVFGMVLLVFSGYLLVS